MKKPALFVVLLVLGLAPSLTLPAQSAPLNPAAVPKLRNDWLDRHEGFVTRAREGGIDLLFVGDSITDFWRNRGQGVWAQRYEPLKAANFGISGDKTEHVLWRLQHGELEGIAPKVAVVMIGTNNTRRDSAAQIAEGVAAIVQEIRQRCPGTKVLLLAVFPRGENPADPARVKIAELNQIIARLDDGQHVFFLDIGAKFLQPDGVLPASVMPDFLHPNEAGYRIWADAMADKLAALLKSSG